MNRVIPQKGRMLMPKEKQTKSKKFFSLTTEERQEIEQEEVNQKEKMEAANKVFDQLDKKLTDK